METRLESGSVLILNSAKFLCAQNQWEMQILAQRFCNVEPPGQASSYPCLGSQRSPFFASFCKHSVSSRGVANQLTQSYPFTLWGTYYTPDFREKGMVSALKELQATSPRDWKPRPLLGYQQMSTDGPLTERALLSPISWEIAEFSEKSSVKWAVSHLLVKVKLFTLFKFPLSFPQKNWITQKMWN